MTRWTLLLALFTAACADGGTKDDTDTDAAGTDDTEETDDTTSDDTDDGSTDDDTDVDDTDVVPTGCTLATASAATQLDQDPLSTDTVVFKRFIETCYDDSSLSGKWRFEVDDTSGGRWCEYEVSFSSSTAISDESCTDCDVVFEQVTFTGAAYSDVGLCALFGIDDDFTDGLEGQYSILGMDESTPQLLTLDDTWEPVDEFGTASFEVLGDEGHLEVNYRLEYEFGE